MKYYEIINQAKFFTAALEQRLSGGQVVSFMQTAGKVILDALGETKKPKIKAVPLASTESMVRMGLYTLSQGRRPGRKRDFTNTRKIGGLVVFESVAPVCGLFECCLDLQAELPPLPSFETPIRQLIRTDGRKWLALVRVVNTETFSIVETFDLPVFGHGLEWAVPKQDGALFDVPPELYGFIEFLRRAMLPLDDEELFAKRIASHGRELVHWLMAAEDAPRPEWSIHEFCPRHNLRIGTLMPELQAAKILAYCLVIDAAMAGISPSHVHSPESNADTFSDDWFSQAQCGDHDTPTRIYHKIAEICVREASFVRSSVQNAKHAEPGSDRLLAGFCSTLWRELGGDDAGIEALSNESSKTDQRWTDAVLAAASGEWRRKSSQPVIVNIGAGVGNCLVRVATTMSERADSATLYASEPDPVAYQTLRLRLLACRLSFAARGQKLALHNSLSESVPWDFLPTSQHPLIVFCDCLPRFPSGAKAIGDLLARRFDCLCELLEKNKQCIVSLRVPADFLDGKEYADMRQRLFASGRTIWVHYDETQERPKDKRLARAFATIILDAASHTLVTSPKRYEKVRAKPELQFPLMPPRLSGGYLSWPSLIDLAAVTPFTGPIERRGMTLIDTDSEALATRVREYLSTDISDAVIVKKYPAMMKDAGRFNATLSRHKLREKTAFTPGNVEPYPFRPFDERFAYLREMRPIFSDPAPDLQVIAGIPDNWFLLASEGNAGIGDGVAAWASPHPCDYDYFTGRSRHFPVWIPEALLEGRRVRSIHGGWEHPEDLRPKANLSPQARRLLDRLGYPDPDTHSDGANLLWDFCLAIMYTPAYGRENQAALRLGWPRLPLPGWEEDKVPPDIRRLLEEYAALGRKMRGILSGSELEHRDILSGIATVRLDKEGTPTDPSLLNNAQRTLSTDWGGRAKGKAVRSKEGALAIKWTGGGLLKQILELADVMGLPAADCLERLGENCADARINNEVCWTDIPGAAWDFTIGGRKVLHKWLSYRDFRVINRPMLPQEMEQFSDIARRLVILTLIGIKLDKMWPELLNECNE